ncbi:D-beta-hydroxybutyrate dehydrogenase, mitochondrial [Petromyzon marinus]|uniref:D-beta-hydroxybutyrate dehydrogenase, mitochondrial n=1 Tax=Petromyzon marinus TaxID=7757 RepID=A0AAJ7UFH6_PETMA|nr:D-beta-hydroxybutyrate dehydrogenase, mitochondrial [Petromyzon marinus]
MAADKILALAKFWRNIRPNIPAKKIRDKAVLVTGCDSGFGLSLAQHLHSKGFKIFAGCLLKDKGGDGAKQLEAMKSERLKVVQMNVASDDEVAKAVEFIRSSLPDPEDGLWGVVNNAGISTFGEIEWTPMDTYKNVAEVNLWGIVRTTKACLPLIRRARGRVVNISSMMGRMGNTARSPYCITKFGIEAFSDCLRYEMMRWGVKVSVVEPGNFIAATALYGEDRVKEIADGMWAKMSPQVQSDYTREYFDRQVTIMLSYTGGGSTDVSPVIEDIQDALTSYFPLTRYTPMDAYWWTRVQAITHLPAGISDRIYFSKK